MVIDNLWGFEDIADTTQKVLDNVNNPKEVKKSKKVSSKLPLCEKLKLIEEEVYKILGQHKNDTLLITTREDFHNYITKAIKVGYIAIDTETNNTTEVINSILMGPCIYTKGEKQVYIPINHVDINSGELLPNQLKEEDVKEEFQRLVDANTKIIFHNASFDIRVIQRTCGIELPCYWDTQIGCRILDENESSKDKSNLKYQYMLHVDKEHGKYDIEGLFGDVGYAQVPPSLFALYAATDPMMTYKLYEYQLHEFEKEENKGIYKLFRDVEIPLIKVVRGIELRGIKVDTEYFKRLKKKYDENLQKLESEISVEMQKLEDIVKKWRLTDEATSKIVKNGKLQKSKSEQLETPINLGSTTQFAILLYDVLKAPIVNKDKPRGTGEEELAEIVKQRPDLTICKLLLERRGYTKILSTYIDNIPQLLDLWPDGKIRVSFNQMGTDTGRFTSGGKIKFLKDGKKEEISGINLQTIPSHNKDIRLLYTASEGNVIVGNDYKAQEPRLTAFMSQDENMINAYKEGKDLYAVIASMSFDRPYEECLEFHPITGEKQPEGKERRSQAKAILLGLEYGRGAASIGEQIGKSKEEAQGIINKFFTAFPKVKKWIDDTHKKVKKVGYVEDWYGRRRRLPNIMLPQYTMEPIKKETSSLSNFNPFFGCEDRVDTSFIEKTKLYEEKLKKAKWGSQVKQVIEDAKKDNLYIKNNSQLIAEAERQSVNAIIQGGAATLTKMAMINIDNDEELNRLGFKLLATIHDEVFGECPEENGEMCAKRLKQVMIDTAKPYMNVPMDGDYYVVKSWYLDEMKAEIIKEFEGLLSKNLTLEEAKDRITKEHCEMLPQELEEILSSLVQ